MPKYCHFSKNSLCLWADSDAEHSFCLILARGTRSKTNPYNRIKELYFKINIIDFIYSAWRVIQFEQEISSKWRKLNGVRWRTELRYDETPLTFPGVSSGVLLLRHVCLKTSAEGPSSRAATSWSSNSAGIFTETRAKLRDLRTTSSSLLGYEQSQSP